MTDGAIFVDTNVFAYALDDAEPVKRDTARETIEAHRREIIVSTQVLLELHAVCTRQLGMDREVTGTASAPSRCSRWSAPTASSSWTR